MKKYLVLLTTILLTQNSFSADAQKVEPTSDIPAKREFPLNQDKKPCEDFHQYVCSIAESRFKLRDDRSRHTFAFNDSRERILESKKEFMKNLPKEKNLTPRGYQIKNFYTSCMDTKSRAKEEKAKLAQVESELTKIKTAKQFQSYLNQQIKKGEHSFMGYWNTPDMDNPLKLNVQVGSNLMDLPDHSYYDKPEVMAAYKDVLTEFFKTADPKMTDAQALAHAEKQVQLQKEFIKTYPVASIRRQRYSERRTSSQDEILKKYPNLQMEDILKGAPKDALVSLPIPESVDFLNTHMTDENLDVMKDLYLYQVGSNIMDEGYPHFYQTQFDFEKKFFGGPQVRPDLQERCTTAASGMFSLELDQILIDRLFPNFDDEKVRELAGKIRGSIAAGLDKNTWLSSESKKEAIRKIQTARLQLVRPQNDKEWDFLPIQKYSSNKFIENKRINAKARFNKHLDDLKHPTNQVAWGMSPLTVNAYYSEAENKFVLPIGILQYPFYDKDGDMLENLGAVGAVTGHELGHSIDDQGSQYDADGKLHQWMTMKDKKEFSDRGQKMISFFNKAGHDGALTQGENIADLVGLTFAYQAAFPEGKGTDEDKKRFFVSYGRLWCTVSRPDYDKMLLKTDPHAAGWARINEQVKHQTAFQDVYKCRAGDKMYLPENERVQIW
jgi:putative endopeptidase